MADKSGDQAGKLTKWFEKNARDLPWRGKKRDPYHVLVSEIMLQQTQVDRVIPKFHEFLDRFPTVSDLARAEEQEVIEVWSGLGYYRRARFLHKAAQAVDDLGGEIPNTYDELVKLPGIGAYTAAAISSLAFNRPDPVIDGNVIRVASRIFATSENLRSSKGNQKIRSWISGLMKRKKHPGKINEGLMELGATICTPHNPLCESCPLSSGCQAYKKDTVEKYPPARPVRAREEHTWIAAICRESNGKWLLKKVEKGPVLKGLWLPPLVFEGEERKAVRLAKSCISGLKVSRGKKLEPIRHSITYRNIVVIPVLFELNRDQKPGEGLVWASPDDPGLPTSSLLAKLASRI